MWTNNKPTLTLKIELVTQYINFHAQAKQIKTRTYKPSLNMQVNNHSLVHHFQSLMFIAKLHKEKQAFEEDYTNWLGFVIYISP